ncbi:S41 family peptidase [Bauldia sp.]|uniref:S41 family peptidase n=1 Tax=Bauldia sp. TaxID=2575872 RepID=UPI003BACE462
MSLSVRFASLVIALPLLAPPALANPNPQSGNRVFDRAVDLVEEHFYAPDNLDEFRDAVAITVANLTDMAEADPAVVSDAIDFVLARLETSHVGHFTPDQVDYYELVDVFRFGFRDRVRQLFPPRGRVTYDGIGIASATIDGKTFITDVYDGGPADRAGLMVGDEIVALDGQPFHEVESFRGRAGVAVSLTVARTVEGPSIDVAVDVERLSPGVGFVSAIADSAEVIEHDGRSIGYLRLWAYTDRQVKSVIEEALSGPLADTEALVLDLRSRWGGAPPTAADTFVGGSPDMSMTYRSGETNTIHARWRKPLVAIIDEGTRSGMEILAYALKDNNITLVGQPTAADVVAGRAFLLPDDSMLEVAVADVFVDGVRLEGAGVAPHIDVPFDVRYAAGADPQRAAALDEVVRQLNAAMTVPKTP